MVFGIVPQDVFERNSFNFLALFSRICQDIKKVFSMFNLLFVTLTSKARRYFIFANEQLGAIL